jgi:Beta-1,3-glucanase/Carbohydrate binding module (family 6)
MVRRRTLLGAAAGAAAISVPIVLSALRSGAQAAAGLPLTVVNDTQAFANGSIRMYVVGSDLATGAAGFVRTSGVFTPCQLSDNGPDGFADLSVALAPSGDTGFALPKMSGRIYFAINAALKFTVVPTPNGAALQYPSGWTPADPNFTVLHDCMEFTYSNDGMFCNTTNVDMFSVPMAIHLTGAGNQTTGTLVPGGRDAIFTGIAAQPDFARLVIGDNLRVIAPGHGLEAGLFSPSYYDSYVDEVWARYATTDLVVRTGSGSVTGRVSGGRLAFTGGVASFATPSTRDVLFCDGALAAPNDGKTGPVAAVLGAAFNRGTLRDQTVQPTTDPAGFYQSTVANHYSRVLHANHVDGRAYGFAFDDVANFASFIQDTAPSSITVTLTPFGRGNPDPGPTATGIPPVPVPTTAAPPAPGGVDAFGRIEAESFIAQGGTAVEACAEGGQDVGWIADSDWLSFAGVSFGSVGAQGFTVRAASGAAAGISGLIDVRLDDRGSAPVGSISVGPTGDWQSWRSIDGALAAPVTGTHTVFLTFRSGQPADFVNLNWFTFRS